MIPDFLYEIKEIKEIVDATVRVAKNCREASEDLVFDFFINTMNETACERWEKMLKLKSDGDLITRRMRVYLKYTNSLPFTVRKLEEFLFNSCQSYEIELKHYFLKIQAKVKDLSDLDLINTSIAEMLPANIDYTVELQLNTWKVLNRKYTWKQISTKTWDKLKKEYL